MTLTYDPNGNIKTLLRKAIDPGSGNNNMDNLIYNYTAGTNKLTHVGETGDNTNLLAFDDIRNESPGNYTYDQNGNLKSDIQEEISNIDWTIYGKIKTLTRTAGSSQPDLEFGYDGNGNRIMKIIKPRTGGILQTQDKWTYTYYIRDAQGNIMANYSRSFLSLGANNWKEPYNETEVDLYGTFTATINAQGMFPSHTTTVTNYSFNTTGFYNRVLGNKQYELSNYLGNVLATVTDMRAVHTTNSIMVDYYLAKVMSAQDYYPYGMLMPGKIYVSAGQHPRILQLVKELEGDPQYYVKKAVVWLKKNITKGK